jgi:hypothetical protein
VNNSRAFIVRNLCASHIVAEKMVIALLAVALLREEACMDRAGPALTARVISNGVARERKCSRQTPLLSSVFASILSDSSMQFQEKLYWRS